MRPLAMAVSLLALMACRPAVDPDKGRYSCAAPADCGPGYECRDQAAGGGRCFKLGECSDTELCDGVDNNCDGQLDETFPGLGDVCDTGRPGLCAPGRKTCVAGAEACPQQSFPTAELCNALDDDCDALTDEGFDLTTDPANCGVCGRACDAGTGCRASACRETACGDAVDNDGNGEADCDDSSCFALECNATLPPSRCGLLPPDAGADGGADGGDDGGLDGGPDAGPDAGDDGGSDGGADGGGDDGGSDGGSDGGGDGGLDGGADGGFVRGCYPPEVDCANGVDDDGDGRADCLDDDCDGRTCVSGTTCALRMCPGPG